jgi:hypothetical protein
MAVLTFYLTAALDSTYRQLSQTAVAAATNADGWVVSTGSTLHSEYQVNVERAATTFTGTTVPDGTLDTTLKDAFICDPVNVVFPAGNWTFTFVVRAVTSATGQAGRIRFRVIKAYADGSNATEITSGQQQGSLTGAMSSTTTDFTSSATVSMPAFFLEGLPTLERLFIQIAWERTTAASMTTADVNWRTGSSASVGTRIVTTNAIISTGPLVTVQIASTAAVNVPTVIQSVVTAGQTLTDTYAFSNANTYQSFQSGAGFTQAVGQTITGNGATLDVVTFLMTRTDVSVTGTLVAKVYAITGTNGTNAIPTGAALATSETVDVTGLPAFNFSSENPGGPTSFVFTGSNRITLANGTVYAIAVHSLTSSGTVQLHMDQSSPTHAGNGVYYDDFDSLWHEDARDTVFKLWTRTYAQAFAPTVFFDQAVTGTTIAAGSIARVPSVAYAVLMGGMTLADSYAFANKDSVVGANNTDKFGQTFQLGTSGELDVTTVVLARSVTSAATGTVVVKLYATTGTFGTDAVPTGAALAVSDAVDVETIIAGQTLNVLSNVVPFRFSSINRIALTNGVPYCLVVDPTLVFEGQGLGVGRDSVGILSPATHAGNRVFYNGTTWTSSGVGDDLVFQVWTRTYAQTFAPTVTPVVPVDQALTGTTITSGSIAQVPSVTYRISLPQITNPSGYVQVPLSSDVQTGTGTPSGGVIIRTPVQPKSQSITRLSGSLTACAVLLSNQGSPTGTVTLEVREAAYNGTLLATSDTVNVSTLPTYPSTVQVWFTLSAPVSLNPATTYFVSLIQPTGLNDGSNYPRAELVAGAAYPYGQLYQVSTPDPASDIMLWLRIYSGVAYELTLPAIIGGATMLCDSYSGSADLAANVTEDGQTFLGNGQRLVGATFQVSRDAATLGTARVTIYATSGTHGTNAVPTGPVLATSNSLSVAPFPVSPSTATQAFVFSGADAIVLAAGTAYALVLTRTVTGGSAQTWSDNTSPGHAGNYVFNSVGWGAVATRDSNFSVTTVAPALFAPTVLPEQTVTGTTIAAGSIARVPSVAYALVGGTIFVPTVSDRYDASNYSNNSGTLNASNFTGEAFVGNGRRLLSAKWYLSRDSGLTSGSLVSRIYAATGTLGSTAKPTGAALASSDAFDAATLNVYNNFLFVSFSFSGANQITLTDGTTYVVTAECTSASGGSVYAGIDAIAPTHQGNRAASTNGGTSWFESPTSDMIFEVGTVGTIFAPIVTLPQAITGATIGGVTSTLPNPAVYWPLNENTGTTSADMGVGY